MEWFILAVQRLEIEAEQWQREADGYALKEREAHAKQHTASWNAAHARAAIKALKEFAEFKALNGEVQ